MKLLMPSFYTLQDNVIFPHMKFSVRPKDDLQAFMQLNMRVGHSIIYSFDGKHSFIEGIAKTSHLDYIIYSEESKDTWLSGKCSILIATTPQIPFANFPIEYIIHTSLPISIYSFIS